MKTVFKTTGPSDDPDLKEARRLHEEVLATRRRTLGPEHPDTITSMNNLAETLRSQGDLSGARRLYEAVLELRRRVLGSDHHDTLTSMNNLAETLRESRPSRALDSRVLREVMVLAHEIEISQERKNNGTINFFLEHMDEIKGIGAAMDPLPQKPKGLYCEDDASAYLSDWMALHADARQVLVTRGYLKTGAGDGRTKVTQ